jgi:tetratricopeptide (TPR) repeat protein
MLAFGLFVTGWAADGTGPLTISQLQSRFLGGNQAYNAGNLDEAIHAYRALLKQGYSAPELHFNLANAYFRAGRTGNAVVHYRLAWYNQPRDPDIRANLQFALNSSGAALPPRNGITALLQTLSLEEWARIAVSAYWLLAAGIVAHLLWAGQSLYLKRTLLFTGLILLVALAGIGSWASFAISPEAVVTQKQQNALFEPLEDGQPHFALPEGAIVRIRERQRDWVRVSSRGRLGWLTDDVLTSVYPWKSEPETL